MTTYKTNQDVYQQITNRIIAAIEAGAPKFEMPWHQGANQSRPVNVLTKKPYRGINTLALWLAQAENDYTTGTWGTYRQWQTYGAQVKKGEHASIIVFFKDLAKSVEEPDETGSTSRRSFIATSSWVFNADQVEGYSDSDSPQIDKTQILERVETLIRATEAKLIESGTIACYNPVSDTIYMPVWRRPGRQAQVRKPGRGITRLAQAKRGKLGIPWLKRLACARGGSPLAGGEWWGKKGALRGNFPVEGGSGKQLAGWSEGEGFPLLNSFHVKYLS